MLRSIKLLNKKVINPKKNLLIIREEGVGDEILYGTMYKDVLESFENTYIESDERDEGIRNILNFGHTLGHLIETKHQSLSITHGEAVINGMFLAIELSYSKGIMSHDNYIKIKDICKNLNIEYNYKLNSNDIDNIKYDKKQSYNKSRFILLKNIGEPIICNDISKDDILNII